MSALGAHRRRRPQLSTIKGLLLCLLALSSCLPAAHAQNATALLASIAEQNSVLVLNETTFPVAAATYDPLFVLFDSPARYGSITLSRRFADAAQAVRRYNSNANSTLRFASLDVSQLTRTLPSKIAVLGMPALLRLRCPSLGKASTRNSTSTLWKPGCSIANGAVDVYTGGRTSMEFQRFILDQPLREVVEVSTQQELSVLAKLRPFVVLFIVDGDDSQAYLDCRVLAQIDADSSAYAVTTNERILAGDEDSLLLNDVPALVLLREFGKQRVVYSGDWNKAALAQFIQNNRYNLISTYTNRESSYFYDRSAVGHVLLFSDPSETYHDALLTETQDIAFQYYSADNNPGKYVLRFVVVPPEEETLKNALFVLDDQYPTVLLVQNISDAPTRLPLYGESSIEMLATGTFAQALSDELINVFPPFGTTDLPDEDDGDGAADPGVPDELTVDWRDYSDLFENRRVPVMLVPIGGLGTVMATADVLDEPSLDEADTSGGASDAFLSLFKLASTPATTAPVLPPYVVEVTDQYQVDSLWPSSNARVLVFVHSSMCYSCRQAKPAVDALVLRLRTDARTKANPIDIVATINIDRVDIRDWPQPYDWLPGIFLLSASQGVAMFPSRSAITVDTLLQFVFPTTSQIQ